jgi:hypothetical protein
MSTDLSTGALAKAEASAKLGTFYAAKVYGKMGNQVSTLRNLVSAFSPPSFSICWCCLQHSAFKL